MTSVNLAKGMTYRGRICIDHSNMAVAIGGGESKIRSSLEGVGFTEVQVWKCGDASVPADWPATSRDDVCSQACRLLQATWSKESGSYPSSGDGWQMIDVWPAVPAGSDYGCLTEGYTCDPTTPFMTCCQSLQCQLDTQKKYGVPDLPPDMRCMAGTPDQLNDPGKKESTSWLTWVVGAAVLAGAGGLAWWLWPGRKHNPAPIGMRTITLYGKEASQVPVLYEKGRLFVFRGGTEKKPGDYVVTENVTGHGLRITAFHSFAKAKRFVLELGNSDVVKDALQEWTGDQQSHGKIDILAAVVREWQAKK